MEINFNPMLIDPVESSFDYVRHISISPEIHLSVRSGRFKLLIFFQGLWFYRFTANLLLDDIKIYQLTNVRRSGIPTIKYEDRNIRMTWNMVFPEIEVILV